jgi:uncharacterized protein with PQ loop repeat
MMDIVEIFGWVGSFCLIICGLPQMIKTIKLKKVEGFSFLFLLLWFLGEFFSLFYVIQKTGKLPLIFNYVINLIVTIILISYYIYYLYRSRDGRE